MALLKKIEEVEKLDYGGCYWGDGRIEIRFILRSNALIWLIFWSVKIKESEKKNDKNRFMHETWIRTLRKYVR